MTRTTGRTRPPIAGRERGSSTVEYSLMVAAIAAMLVGVILGVGRLVPSALHSDSCPGQAQQVGSQCDLGSGTDGS